MDSVVEDSHLSESVQANFQVSCSWPSPFSHICTRLVRRGRLSELEVRLISNNDLSLYYRALLMSNPLARSARA